MASTENYFLNEDAMQEGSPQGILERGEDAALPPLLIIQGPADKNIPMSMPHAFVESYRAAGGSVELEEYPDMPHNFILRVGKETDHALGVVKAFVAQPVDGIYRRNACRLTYRVQCRSLSVRCR